MTDLLPLTLLAPLLILVAYRDLRDLRIPDALTMAALVGFAVSLVWGVPADLGWRLIIAAAVFALGFGAFAMRLLGGGDVKFLPALILFVPVHWLPVFANLFSAALILGVIGILVMKRMPSLAGLGWESLGPDRSFPMGISIAGAGLALPWVAQALG